MHWVNHTDDMIFFRIKNGKIHGVMAIFYFLTICDPLFYIEHRWSNKMAVLGVRMTYESYDKKNHSYNLTQMNKDPA